MSSSSLINDRIVTRTKDDSNNDNNSTNQSNSKKNDDSSSASSVSTIRSKSLISMNMLDLSTNNNHNNHHSTITNNHQPSNNHHHDDDEDAEDSSSSNNEEEWSSSNSSSSTSSSSSNTGSSRSNDDFSFHQEENGTFPTTTTVKQNQDDNASTSTASSIIRSQSLMTIIMKSENDGDDDTNHLIINTSASVHDGDDEKSTAISCSSIVKSKSLFSSLSSSSDTSPRFPKNNPNIEIINDDNSSISSSSLFRTPPKLISRNFNNHYLKSPSHNNHKDDDDDDEEESLILDDSSMSAKFLVNPPKNIRTTNVPSVTTTAMHHPYHNYYLSSPSSSQNNISISSSQSPFLMHSMDVSPISNTLVDLNNCQPKQQQQQQQQPDLPNVIHNVTIPTNTDDITISTTSSIPISPLRFRQPDKAYLPSNTILSIQEQNDESTKSSKNKEENKKEEDDDDDEDTQEIISLLDGGNEKQEEISDNGNDDDGNNKKLESYIHGYIQFRKDISQLQEQQQLNGTNNKKEQIIDSLEDILETLSSSFIDQHQQYPPPQRRHAKKTIKNQQRQRHGRERHWKDDTNRQKYDVSTTEANDEYKEDDDDLTFLYSILSKQPNHPFVRILPYTRFLHLIFATFHTNLQLWSSDTTPQIPRQSQRVLTILANLLDVLLQQTRSIHNQIHEQTPILSSSPPKEIISMAMMMNENLQMKQIYSILSNSTMKSDKNNSDDEHTNQINASITIIQLIIAIIGEGAFYLKTISQTTKNGIVNYEDSKISSFYNGSINDRSFAAALMLGKVVPSELNHDKIKAQQTAMTNNTSSKGLFHTTFKKRRKIMEKKLRSWIKNTELILSDFHQTSSSSILQSFCINSNITVSYEKDDHSTTSNNNDDDALNYLLYRLIPETLLIGKLQDTETIVQITSTLVRKGKKKKLEQSKREAYTDLQNTRTKTSTKQHISSSPYCRQKTFLDFDNSKVTSTTPFSLMLIIIAFFIILQWQNEKISSLPPQRQQQLVLFGSGIFVLLLVYLSRIILFYYYYSHSANDYSDGGLSSPYGTATSKNIYHGCSFGNQIPNLPTNLLTRKKLQNEIIESILNKSASKIKATIKPATTIISGKEGYGKSTLVSMIVRQSIIKRLFYDGIIWLDMHNCANSSSTNMTYGSLIQFYARICQQLCSFKHPNNNNSPLSRIASNFNAYQYYLKPGDESHDMIELMRDFHQHFFRLFNLDKYHLLLVLNGLENMEDMKWFLPPECNNSGNDQIYSNKFHLLVTTCQNEPFKNKDDCEVHVIDNIDELEKKNFISNEIMEKLPLSCNKISQDTVSTLLDSITGSKIKSIHGFQCAAQLLSYTSMNDISFDSTQVINTISKILTTTHETVSGKDDEDEITIIYNLFKFMMNRKGAIGEILTKCFSILIYLHFNEQLSPNESSTDAFIPSKILSHLWNTLLNSQEISMKEIIVLDQHIAALGKDEFSQFSARPIFITNELVNLGLLKSYKNDDDIFSRNVISRTYRIDHGIWRQIGKKCFNDIKWRSSTDVNLEIIETMSNYMVHTYKDYLADVFNRKNLKDNKCSMENHFLARDLIRLMMNAKLSDDALRLFTETQFILFRFQNLGILQATIQQISDAETLFLQILSNEKFYYSPAGKRDVEKTVLRSKIILSFETILDALLKSEQTMKNNPRIIAIALSLIGNFLAKNHFISEAYVYFQECEGILELLYDNSQVSDYFLNRLFARNQSGIGYIHLQRSNFEEALEFFTDSLYYSKYPKNTSYSHESASIFNQIGEVHREMGNIEAALIAYQQALSHIEASFGIENQFFCSTQLKVGETYFAMDKIEDGKKAFDKSLIEMKRQFGKKSVSTASILYSIGIAYAGKELFDQAISYLKEAVDVWSEITLQDSSMREDLATTLHSLGFAYRKQGDLEIALEVYNEALSIRQVTLGYQHEKTALTYHNIGIVYCEMGKHDEAMTAYAKALQTNRSAISCIPNSTLSAHRWGELTSTNPQDEETMISLTNALWGSKSLHIDAPPIETIISRCEYIFGPEIKDKPCYSSRVIACSTLVVDRIIETEYRNTANPQQEEGLLTKWLEPLIPLLCAIVKAEVGSSTLDNVQEKKKKVSFCPYDFRTINTPIDMLGIESTVHLDATISLLHNVVQETSACIKKYGTDGKLHTQEITKMILVLHIMSSHGEGKALRLACAESMPSCDSWPDNRFFGSAKLLREEFEFVLTMMEPISLENKNEEVKWQSPIRERLSTMLGNMIRFLLRRFFDPVPIAYTVPSNRHPVKDYTFCRAKTCEIISLAQPENLSGTASLPNRKRTSDHVPLWERSISNVVIFATQCIHIYFENVTELRSSFEFSDTNKLKEGQTDVMFRLSNASQLCLQSSSREQKKLPDSDLDEILDDISIAHTCLSAWKASWFMLSLFNIEAVDDAIRNAGGWGQIERLAGILYSCNLNHDFPDEAHFITLKSISQLKKTLVIHKSEMSALGRASKKFLQSLWKRFKRESPLRRKDSKESFVRKALMEGSNMSTFPNVLFYDEHESL